MAQVLINPGHGGNDGGAAGNGLLEKNLTLSLSLKVGAILQKNNISIAYTRTGDVFTNVTQIANNANSGGHGIFVSIHINSHHTPSANGVETLFHPNDGKGKQLSNNIQSELVKSKIFRSNRGIKARTDLAVLRITKMPATLVELGFISNPQDAQLLRSKQDAMAEAVARGIMSYLGGNFKEGSQDAAGSVGGAAALGSGDGMSNLISNLMGQRNQGGNSVDWSSNNFLMNWNYTPIDEQVPDINWFDGSGPARTNNPGDIMTEGRGSSGADAYEKGEEGDFSGTVQKNDNSKNPNFARPISNYRVSSEWGQRGGRMHNGIDLAATTGTPIYSATDGVIDYRGVFGGGGNTVIVKSNVGNYFTVYMHMSRFGNVKVGQVVKQGQLIGYVGSTGNSTGPHLHLEIRKGARQGTSLNPRTFISF